MLDGITSYLFVPATEPGRIDKARESEAGAVIVDLEDAVADDQKRRARDVLSDRLGLRRRRGLQLVRINDLTTPHAESDLRATVGLPIDGIVVPKAQPETLPALPADGPPIVALVETAQGIRGAYDIAALPRVAALMLGPIDLAAELGIRPSADGRELLFARSSLVIDSIAAGLPGPIDGPCPAIRDSDRVRVEARDARALGFSGKACIHPAQLPVVHEVFAPTADELQWARWVVAAADAAASEGRGGVIALDGEMIDAPVLARARRLLAAGGER